MPESFISEKLYNAYRSKYSFPRKGDILISAAGTLGKTVVYNGAPAYFQDSNIVWVANDESIVLNSFLYYFYQTKPWQTTSGSTINRIYNEDLRSLEIPHPDLPCQTRIAAVLSALDAKIELNQRINAELEGMAKLLYDYWFVQFDFPMTAAQAAALGKPKLAGHPYRASGGKMIYNETLKRDIPEGWEVRKLNEVGTFKNGINYCPQDVGDTMAHIINVRNMSSSSFFLETSSLDEILLIGKSVKNYLVSEKSVLIARSGIPGATRLIQNQKDNTIYCGFIICFEPYQMKDRNLVFFNMKMIEKAMTSNAAGTVLKNVSQDTLKALCIPFPGNNRSDSTLEKFNTVIDPIFTELGTLQQQTQELTQLRDWLLPMLMNGQVTVG